MLKAPKRRELRLLSAEEIRKLLKCAHGRYRGIILIAATTGLRLSEILWLTWGDVYWDENRIAVRAKKGWTTKSHQNRSVFVPASVINWLREHRQSAVLKKPRSSIHWPETSMGMLLVMVEKLLSLRASRSNRTAKSPPWTTVVST